MPVAIEPARCNRLVGRPMTECACRLADGWAECPPAARKGSGQRRRGAGGADRSGGADPFCGGPAASFTGDLCPDCGSFLMVRTGTCATCQNCGTTGGCG
jgi:hypothetical protein